MFKLGVPARLTRLKHDPATATIPVILLTAKSEDEDVLTGYKEGAEYYITKPCKMEDFRVSLERWVRVAQAS